MEPEVVITEESVRRLISAFEARNFTRAHWNHAARLTVTMWYLLTLAEADATTKLIAGLRALARSNSLPNEAAGGYNETTTMFWLIIARSFLDCYGSGSTRLELLNRFLRVYAHRDSLILEHYSPATLRSWRARSSWVEPDFKPVAAIDHDANMFGVDR